MTTEDYEPLEPGERKREAALMEGVFGVLNDCGLPGLMNPGG